MKEKVIFDTNAVNNDDSNYFFGNRKELALFAQSAEIVIPKIVIEELRRKKTRKLLSKRQSFIDNPFHRFKGLTKEETKQYNIDEHIQNLLDNEEYDFTIIDLKDNSVFDNIKELALKKQPPFEKSDDTDKGFKDALIYFTILEYLQEIPDKYIFVCVKDGRFKEALQKHDNIIIVKDYSEFKQKSISQFFDDYFIESVNIEITDVEITKEYIVEYWHNINDNQNVLIKVEDDEYIIEVDSGEIVGSSKPELYKPNIELLIKSDDFETTHNAIEELSSFENYFSDEDIFKILNASFSNEKIKWIINEDDVKEFIGTLYKAKSELVENDVAEFLKEIFE